MTTIKFLYTTLAITASILFMNCSTPKENNTTAESKIPPGHAKIVGVITEIEPISEGPNLSDPCSKAPCTALVKVSSALYGASFPQLAMNKEVRVKFLFTLEKTTKKLFPNMKEEYPGLKVGQEFTALVAHVENIDETAPIFQIHGYETN
jgi:hypothetical protein